MVLFHNLIPAGPGWTLLATTTRWLSLSLHVLNLAAGIAKCRVAVVPNYAGVVLPEQHIEYDAGLLVDDAIDDTQIILPPGYSVLAMADNDCSMRLAGYPIEDRFGVYWPGILPAVGAYARLGVAAQASQVTVLMCNLDPVPVIASMYVAAGGYVNGTQPPRGRSYACNVTIPAAGENRGGIWVETNLPLDPGEAIVIVSGGRLACHVFGITR